jgi:tRNA-Thr(GGU) m(6)t(6)A37 methyltransferase TsaA
MPDDTFNTDRLRVIGRIESPLVDLTAAPLQGDEGDIRARVILDERYEAAAEGIHPGDRIILITWLHLAERDTISVHPRGDRARPPTGVFATRSAGRPNPIGLHPVHVIEVSGGAITVSPLEVIDGTPVLDIKPELADPDDR